MKIKDFKEKIEIADDVDFSLDGNKVTIKSKTGEVTKEFKMPRFVFSKEDKSLVVSCKDFNTYDKRSLNTVKAHIKNMIQGAKEGFTYKLKICSGHFPMNVALSGKKIVVKNLFGEKVPRELILPEGPKVEIKGDIIEVTGPDLESVSLAAAKIEQLTIITNRDRRIFQDGIYVIDKAGRGI